MSTMSTPDATAPFHTDSGRIGVLFVHGFTGSPASLRPWAEAVAAAGHRVALPRLPGHGTVWQELAVTSWHDWYAAVEAEFRTLQDACDQVFVFGLSMGGALALRLAEHHPGVAGLVLVNPALAAVDKRARFAGLMHRIVRTTTSIGNDIAKPGQDEGSYDTVPVVAVAEMHRLFADVRSMLDLVTCPLLVFRSRVDHVVPASSTETVLRHVSSRQVTEVVLERSLHVATLDWDADQVFVEARAFMSQVTAAASQKAPQSSPHLVA